VMGAGIYVVWPAFYTDVTDAYRLGRWGRVRTDLGGVYFNILFALGIAGAYALTGFEPILLLIVIQHFQILQQMLPFLRLDGYYVLSDLTGVPDLFMRVKPTLKAAIPGMETEDSVHDLKRWVRVAVTAWVVFLIPTLLFVFGMMVFNAPRIFATAYDSFFVQYDKAHASFSNGNTLKGVANGVQMVLLTLPTLGMTASFGRVAVKTAQGLWGWAADNVLKRAAIGAVLAAAVGVAGYVLLPNGEYKPIQPGERGTINVAQFEQVGSGRPGLTEKRERDLGGAPSERKKPRSTDSEIDTNQTAETNETTTGTRTSTTSTGDSATTPAGTTPAETSTAPASTAPASTTTTSTTTATVTTSTTVTTETATTPTTTTETVTTTTTAAP
jgi:putative peptide zinc metalloprotease protein